VRPRAIHELDEPARALAEARRVLAPGGRIVLISQDWDTIVIDSDDPPSPGRSSTPAPTPSPRPEPPAATANLLIDAGFHRPDVEVTPEPR
jgi:ubiquinone/menaquinone biosynthesis C-methylase UbiE